MEDTQVLGGTVGVEDAATPDTGNADQASTDTTTQPSPIEWDSIFDRADAKEKVQEYLAKDPDFKANVSKSVRQRDIEDRAAVKASEMAKSATAELEVVRAELAKINAAREMEAMSTMTDDEQKIYKVARAWEQERKQRESVEQELSRYREDDALTKVKKFAQEKWGLDSEDVERFNGIDPNKLIPHVLEEAGRKISESRSAMKTLEDRLAALERQNSGVSVTAAASGSQPGGGNMSDDQITDLYLSLPSTDARRTRVSEEYEKLRVRRGY